MSTAFDHGDDASDNPFDSSYEEYIRTVEAKGADDPEPTQATGAESADDSNTPEDTEDASDSSYLGNGVKAPWSNLAETTEGDPFANPDEEAPESN